MIWKEFFFDVASVSILWFLQTLIQNLMASNNTTYFMKTFIYKILIKKQKLLKKSISK